MKTRTAWLVILVALCACGKESMPQKPQLAVDRDSIAFGVEFGSGTYVGTAPQESLMISNGGLENLILSGVSLAGDKEFTIDGPLKSELKGKERTYLRILFAPKQVKSYSATLTINSNAENTPIKLVPISGRGVAVPDGGG